LFQKENLLTAERIYVNGVSVTMNSKELIAPVSISPLSELARLLVRLDYVWQLHRTRESRRPCERLRTQRFIVRADEKLTAFVELETAVYLHGLFKRGGDGRTSPVC